MTELELHAERDAYYASFRFPDSGSDAPLAVLSLRKAGSMRFRRGEPNPNRGAFFSSLGLEPKAAPGIELLHSCIVRTMDGTAESPDFAGDGLWATETELVPNVTVADCMPIWFFDRFSRSFGALHSGWQGTGISLALLSTLASRFGTRPRDVSFILGPCIGPCCYRVSPERAANYAQAWGRAAVAFREGSWRLDLRAANARALLSSGAGSVASFSRCTSCGLEFGSYRREGAVSYTRMAALAFMP